MLPSFACPKITASSYPCLRNNSCNPMHVAAKCSGGTAMSSNKAVVPDFLAPATAAYKPFRMCQSFARSAGSEISCGLFTHGRAAIALCADSISTANDCSSDAWYSTNRAAWFLRVNPAKSTLPARSDGASINSMVAGLVGISTSSAWVAVIRSSKIIRVVAAYFNSGTVLKIASETNPKVPSLPMMMCRKMSITESKSTNELSPYPMVFLIWY